MHLVILIVLCAFVPPASFTAHAQPSSAPPSSLPVTPLSPSFDRSGIGSCDLCRPLDGRPGSNLQHHRLRRDHDLHPHKKTPGIGRSRKRSFMSQLPHRKLEENQEEGSER
jgi:hypothetical protein